MMARGNDRSVEKRPDVPQLSEEARRRQRMRSYAIAGLLLLLVALFYAATIVRLGGNALNRPI
ncbi:MAG: hypothetical protein AB7E80_07230 [Hyphomicrobiaceae bacterium]